MVRSTIGISVLVMAGLLTGCEEPVDDDFDVTERRAVPGDIDDLAAAERPGDQIATHQHWVPHVSTVHANLGEDVLLSVRERVFAPSGDDAPAEASRGVVLFIHGASIPPAGAFDFDYEDYSWMEYLARDGYDVFSLDHQGYGLSPRPEMDDPCNVALSNQGQLLGGNPLDSTCPPSYPYVFGTSDAEWDEIDSTVEYLKALRGVEKVTLVAWSLGGVRAGGYAARHPENVERLVLFAPLYIPFFGSNPPAVLPQPGAPMTLQSRSDLENLRWNVDCEGQVDDTARDSIWEAVMSVDDLGSQWGPPGAGGVQRVQTRAIYGWTATESAQIEVPTLTIVGENDGLYNAAQAQQRALVNTDSVLINVECASHFMMWEKQRHVLQRATLEFLRNDAIAKVEQGTLRVDYDGNFEQIE